MSEPLLLRIEGKCVADDETLYRNMESAAALGLPEISSVSPIQPTPIALVGSGPSVASQLPALHRLRAQGVPIVGIKDAHDWLIASGLVPDMAFAVDPQAKRARCFRVPSHDVHYLVASQCDPGMFEHLAGYRVTIWHPYVRHGQTRPKNKILIGGGTTSGLRALSLFYVMGYRHFLLFGYDSCMDGSNLRVDGSGVADGDEVTEVKLDPKDERGFYCNPAMALQAQDFQEYSWFMPDATFEVFGDGLIAEIVKRREAARLELEAAAQVQVKNDLVSFIHSGNSAVASYRYRAEVPARALGAQINDHGAGTLIFSKPQATELMDMARARNRGQRVIVDFCDDHFGWTHYKEAGRIADAVTCPTNAMAAIVRANTGHEPFVVPDPYEFEEAPAHCSGDKLLWFGYWHESNREAVERIWPVISRYPLKMVGNGGDGMIPYSRRALLKCLAEADIVVLPATDAYKSPNRAVQAIRRGCFVVAEPHPALEGIPGIWVGDIEEGIEWARCHIDEANQRTWEAQRYVETAFSPQTVADAWKKAIRPPTTSDAEAGTGRDGLTSTSHRMQISDPISAILTQSQATQPTP